MFIVEKTDKSADVSFVLLNIFEKLTKLKIFLYNSFLQLRKTKKIVEVWEK